MSETRETDGPTAVLDEAHIGDIQGAFGTIRQHDTGARRSWTARLLTLLAIMGPGLIVMIGDNDAGGVSTYSQAGQNFGLTLLWTLPLLIPVLIVNQEMVVRLGAVTGVGHARLINERFGRFWGMFSVGDLFILNFLTIATEFIGVSLALGYFGVSEYYSVPIAAVTLVAMTATGSFRRWERFMFVFIFANFLVIPLAFMSHPTAGPFFKGLVTPGVHGRLQLHLGAPDHRHRGHDRRPVAALLPAVEHRRQADHAPLDQLRARRHRRRLAGRRVRRRPPHGGTGRRLRPHAAVRPVHQRRRRGRGPEALRQQCSGHHLRHRVAERLHHRRRRGDPLHVVRLRGRLRRPPLLAPEFPRRQILLRSVQRHGGPRRGHRHHPRRATRGHHDRCPGSGRRAAPQRHRLPPAALQRQGRAGPLGEPSLAERGGHASSSPSC